MEGPTGVSGNSRAPVPVRDFVRFLIILHGHAIYNVFLRYAASAFTTFSFNYIHPLLGISFFRNGAIELLFRVPEMKRHLCLPWSEIFIIAQLSVRNESGQTIDATGFVSRRCQRLRGAANHRKSEGNPGVSESDIERW